jgi:hypothetical protein
VVLQNLDSLGTVSCFNGINDRGMVTARHELIGAVAGDRNAYPTLQVPPGVNQ